MNICFISLGCPKNTVNSEQMVYLAQEAGHRIVPVPEQAEAVVVNTCAFIESATQEAIDTIIEIGQLKQTAGVKYLVVAGCLAQRYRKEILEELPEVDALIGIASFGEIARVLAQLSEAETVIERFADKHSPVEELGRTVSTGGSWAYLRIAEGCNNCCSFCVIPSIRGRYRSRSMDAIVKEAEGLAAQGYKELIVIAQDITRYGEDLYGGRSLAALLKRLCAIDGIQWLRLSGHPHPAHQRRDFKIHEPPGYRRRDSGTVHQTPGPDAGRCAAHQSHHWPARGGRGRIRGTVRLFAVRQDPAGGRIPVLSRGRHPRGEDAPRGL